MKRFFITATGTEIGKTMLTTALIRVLRAAGKNVIAQKPVISGWDDQENDSYHILDALGLPRTDLSKVTRYRYDASLSPDIAARIEGNPIDLEVLAAFCSPNTTADIQLIEGAGGVMVPLNDKHLMLDLMERLSAPAILVTGSYLGAISHTLTAYKALRARNIAVKAVVISESEESAGIDEMATTLKNFISAPIFLIHRLAKGDRLETRVPEILRIVE